MDSETCVTQTFDKGTLACDADCAAFDTSACAFFSCGDNLQEGAESCDGTDLAGETCVTFGFASGSLSCAANCGSFISTACISHPGEDNESKVDASSPKPNVGISNLEVLYGSSLDKSNSLLNNIVINVDSADNLLVLNLNLFAENISAEISPLSVSVFVDGFLVNSSKASLHSTEVLTNLAIPINLVNFDIGLHEVIVELGQVGIAGENLEDNSFTFTVNIVNYQLTGDLTGSDTSNGADSDSSSVVSVQSTTVDAGKSQLVKKGTLAKGLPEDSGITQSAIVKSVIKNVKNFFDFIFSIVGINN